MTTVQPVNVFPSSTSQTVASLGTKLAPKDSRSIQAVSTEFEGMFLSQLLKEMRGTLQPGTMFEGDKSDIQGGLFDMIMSKHLASSGGVGLGAYLQQALQTRSASGNPTNHGTATHQSTHAVGGAISSTSKS